MKYTLRPATPGRDFAAELNPEQYAAVSTDARHALVIAGAGSGKTRTLTYRVARLLECGVAPWRILLLTFTNKAAREMLERVGQLTGQGSEQIWGGTFHSVANRLLRRHAQRLGYLPGFSILDSDDQRALFRALVKQYSGKTTKADRFPKPEVLIGLHSLAINTGRTWQDTLVQDYGHLERFEEAIGKIFEAYRARKQESNSMDFDDLLTNMVRLLKEHADVRHDLQDRFLHVLVDEYQDTNTLQAELIALLAGGESTSLMVVGDDAQSIYSWRGANVDHIFDFTHTYPDAQVYKIETNYRSVPAILEISNAAIAQNSRQFVKTLRPARDAGKLKPAVIPAPDNRTEARFVAQRIDELMGAGIPGKDIAVLYRAHFHSMDVQMELTRNHIPFRITSGLRFFEQAHIKDIVAWLRLLANPRDEVAFRRIVGTFPRVGDATAAKLWQGWLSAIEAWFAANPAETTITSPHSDVLKKVSVPAAARLHWGGFLTSMDSLHPADRELTPTELVKLVQNYMNAYMRSAYDNYEERMEDIGQLVKSLSDMPDLDTFLSQVALLSEVDNDTAQDDDCVTLSTIHQAKGLEWKIVFVIFLGEGLFPHYRVITGGDPDDIEEETRLFYVALTRAEDQLYLSYPRYNGHSYDSQFCPPSRFLTTLPEGLFELWNI
ncbi:MAG: ATP-dependent helicase [Akkermansia sp.]|nr:ATP-dependent helicase [Akkermansia sp.]